MKKIIFLFLAFFIHFESFSQSEIKQLTAISWKAGSSKVLYGTEIKKLEGKNGNYQGITNVGYESPEYLMDYYTKKAKEEMWKSGELEEILAEIENNYPGGLVMLYISRSTLNSANTENYTIIIKDSNEKEIYRESLENNFPEYDNGKYWNFGYAYITEKISGKNYIYVVDALGDSENKVFKFEINLE